MLPGWRSKEIDCPPRLQSRRAPHIYSARAAMPVELSTPERDEGYTPSACVAVKFDKPNLALIARIGRYTEMISIEVVGV
jgi:hypothetical protein